MAHICWFQGVFWVAFPEKICSFCDFNWHYIFVLDLVRLPSLCSIPTAFSLRFSGKVDSVFKDLLSKNTRSEPISSFSVAHGTQSKCKATYLSLKKWRTEINCKVLKCHEER
ncbi:hypothetical protein SLEP1_g5534 [Rubroshorea leprosula]|uniref:Uncharacterized protein n=1 Tax=Rubroshorea leprosula TaxID=152421 RepID=A0AAV5HSA5_9ROSI|nr:hypothetical protein SLEP1_g5534 [Rubroshorea leprosula]